MIFKASSKNKTEQRKKKRNKKSNDGRQESRKIEGGGCKRCVGDFFIISRRIPVFGCFAVHQYRRRERERERERIWEPLVQSLNHSLSFIHR